MRSTFWAAAAILCCGVLAAQTPALNPPLRFTATTANVTGAPDSIRIDLMRWSTDVERDKLMSAWNLKPAADSKADSKGEAGRGAAGRGAARGGGRGGRGAIEEAAPQTPQAALAAALQGAPTVGYLWSSEVAGYAIRYAGKTAGPDGSERILLITDRRLGAITGLWQPAAPTPPSAYDFSVIELRVGSKGEGEGKISITGQVVPDSAAGIVALADYAALPVVLTKMKLQKP